MSDCVCRGCGQVYYVAQMILIPQKHIGDGRGPGGTCSGMWNPPPVVNASPCCEKAVACPRCGDDACSDCDNDVIDCTVIGPVHEVCHVCPRCDEMEDVA